MRTAIMLVAGLMLSACVFVKKAPPAHAPKNHGQARSQEVHERNDARKAAKNDDHGNGKVK